MTPELQAEIAALRRDMAHHLKTQGELSERSHDLARRLRETGMNNNAIAAAMGLSKQRVSQLLEPIRPRRKK